MYINISNKAKLKQSLNQKDTSEVRQLCSTGGAIIEAGEFPPRLYVVKIAWLDVKLYNWYI